MTRNSLDLSNRLDGVRTEILVQVDAAARRLKLPFMLVGATARDLLLEAAHGIQTGRATEDVDVAVSVDSWEVFERLRAELIESGRFRPADSGIQRLESDRPVPLDIVPFGDIESEQHTIAWPPEHDIVMKTLGFREVYEAALTVKVKPSLELRVASLPGLSVLKLIAWDERREQRDAHDITTIATNYLDAGNLARLPVELPQLLEQEDFDYVMAGARLLGYDIRSFVVEETKVALLELLQRELAEEGHWRLPSEMALAVTARTDAADYALRLLGEIKAGLKG